MVEDDPGSLATIFGVAFRDTRPPVYVPERSDVTTFVRVVMVLKLLFVCVSASSQVFLTCWRVHHLFFSFKAPRGFWLNKRLNVAEIFRRSRFYCPCRHTRCVWGVIRSWWAEQNMSRGLVLCSNYQSQIDSDNIMVCISVLRTQVNVCPPHAPEKLCFG